MYREGGFRSFHTIYAQSAIVGRLSIPVIFGFSFRLRIWFSNTTCKKNVFETAYQCLQTGQRLHELWVESNKRSRWEVGCCTPCEARSIRGLRRSPPKISGGDEDCESDCWVTSAALRFLDVPAVGPWVAVREREALEVLSLDGSVFHKAFSIAISVGWRRRCAKYWYFKYFTCCLSTEWWDEALKFP